MVQDHNYRSRTAVRELNGAGVKLPGAVVDAVALLDRVSQFEPPPAPDVSDLILAGAKQSEISAAVVQHLGAGHVQQAHSQAVQVAGERVIGAILDNRSEIHAQLRERADQLITAITAAAKITEPLAALVRAGRTTDAELIAQKDVHCEQLDRLYQLRDQYLTPRRTAYGIGHFDCGRWKDPNVVAHHARPSGTLFESWAAGINAGGVLWYPDADEAQKSAQPLYDQWEAEARRLKSLQRAGSHAFG